MDKIHPTHSPSRQTTDSAKELITSTESMKVQNPSLEELPAELMLEIFSSATAGDDRVSPFTLATICRTWRHIALANSQLWSKVDYRLPFHPPHRLDQFDMWVTRAGASPLSIAIRTFDRDPSSQEDRIDTEFRKVGWKLLVDRVCAKSTQMASLELSVPNEFLDMWAFREVVPAFPILSYLYINPESHSLSDPHCKIDFGHAHQLRTVKITELYMSFLDLPWEALTCLTLDHPSSFEIRDALSQASNLEILRSHRTIDHCTDDHLITNTSLRRLILDRMEDAPSDLPSEVLLSIALPGLESLELNMKDEVDNSLIPIDLHPLISSSQFQLGELILQSAALQEVPFVDCLHLLPSLRVLSLDNVIWFGSNGWTGSSIPFSLYLCENLARPRAIPDRLLPNLESLTITVGVDAMQEADADDARGVIMRLLKARGGTVADEVDLPVCIFKGIFFTSLTDMERSISDILEEKGVRVVLS